MSEEIAETNEPKRLGMPPSEIAKRITEGQPVRFQEYLAARADLPEQTFLSDFSRQVSQTERTILNTGKTLPSVSRNTWDDMTNSQRSAHSAAVGGVYDLDDRQSGGGSMKNKSGQILSRSEWDVMSNDRRASWIHE